MNWYPPSMLLAPNYCFIYPSFHGVSIPNCGLTRLASRDKKFRVPMIHAKYYVLVALLRTWYERTLVRSTRVEQGPKVAALGRSKGNFGDPTVRPTLLPEWGFPWEMMFPSMCWLSALPCPILSSPVVSCLVVPCRAPASSPPTRCQ